jgi:hypothetical protein
VWRLLCVSVALLNQRGCRTLRRCAPSRMLLRHHQKCSSAQCPVCTPVKQYVSKQRMMVMSRKAAQLPPEQRQAVLLQLQQAGQTHQDLMAVMDSGGAQVGGRPGGARFFGGMGPWGTGLRGVCAW